MRDYRAQGETAGAIFYAPADEVWRGHYALHLSVRPSVRPPNWFPHNNFKNLGRILDIFEM